MAPWFSKDLNTLLKEKDWKFVKYRLRTAWGKYEVQKIKRSYVVPSLVKRRTSLHTAIKHKASLSIVETLIKLHPLAVDEKCDVIGMKKRPLHVACEKGSSLEVIEALCTASPKSLEKKDMLRRTPLDIAIHCGADEDVIEVLSRGRQYYEKKKRMMKQSLAASSLGSIGDIIFNDPVCGKKSPCELFKNDSIWRENPNENPDLIWKEKARNTPSSNGIPKVMWKKDVGGSPTSATWMDSLYRADTSTTENSFQNSAISPSPPAMIDPFLSNINNENETIDRNHRGVPSSIAFPALDLCVTNSPAELEHTQDLDDQTDDDYQPFYVSFMNELKTVAFLVGLITLIFTRMEGRFYPRLSVTIANMICVLFFRTFGYELFVT